MVLAMNWQTTVVDKLLFGKVICNIPYSYVAIKFGEQLILMNWRITTTLDRQIKNFANIHDAAVTLGT